MRNRRHATRSRGRGRPRCLGWLSERLGLLGRRPRSYGVSERPGQRFETGDCAPAEALLAMPWLQCPHSPGRGAASGTRVSPACARCGRWPSPCPPRRPCAVPATATPRNAPRSGRPISVTIVRLAPTLMPSMLVRSNAAARYSAMHTGCWPRERSAFCLVGLGCCSGSRSHHSSQASSTRSCSIRRS